MIHHDVTLALIDNSIGYGVVAEKFIPIGTIVWTRCQLDRDFTLSEVLKMPPAYYPLIEKYSYIDGKGTFILSWDLDRFVNHSCNPSCLELGGEDYIIAVRDINPGDQITYDYGMLNRLYDMECYCREENCRKIIKNSDISNYHDQWMKRVQAALPNAKNVAQPLRHFMQNPSHFEKLINYSIPLAPYENLYCSQDCMEKLRAISKTHAPATKSLP